MAGVLFCVIVNSSVATLCIVSQIMVTYSQTSLVLLLCLLTRSVPRPVAVEVTDEGVSQLIPD